MQSWKNQVFLYEAQLRKYKYRQFKNTVNVRTTRSSDQKFLMIFVLEIVSKNNCFQHVFVFYELFLK
jgi:hypothetical protein